MTDEVIWTLVRGLEGLFGEGGLKGEFPGSEPNRRGKIFSAVFHAQQDYFDFFSDHGVIEREEEGVIGFLSADGAFLGGEEEKAAKGRDGHFDGVAALRSCPRISL